MNSIYQKLIALIVILLFTFNLDAQIQSKSVQLNTQQNQQGNTLLGGSALSQNQNSSEYVRCYSVEMHQQRLQREGISNYDENFENWLAPLILQKTQQIENGSQRRAAVTVPIIFHIITDGAGPTNLSSAIIEAQINQLNLDFNNQGGPNGTSSSSAVSADAEIVFVAATVDPEGNPLAEPGVNRVTQFGAGPFPTSDFDLGDGGLEIKPNTIWDRSKYANVWTANITGGILGYAQFPTNSTLPGLNTNGGSALNDGVVCGFGTIGARDFPGSAPPYNLGRTLTHEIGHWIGLRHIWGDGGCGVDDFVDDTPLAGGSNFGCVNPPSCGSDDMVENYMDYTDDSCMDIFTAGQVTRMDTVLENATGISDLPSSTTANPVPPTIFFPNKTIVVNEGSGCGFTDINIPVSLLPDGPSNLSVANMIIDSGSANNVLDYEIITPNINFPANETGQQNLILRVFEDDFVEDDETINISISVNANGGNAIAGVNNVLSVTIIDDDVLPSSQNNSTLFEDDFESYDDFIINNIGSWTFVDGDGFTTFGSDATNFTNEGYTGSFIVFNPQQTVPVSNPAWNAFDGDKGLYCFNATDNNAANGLESNDDYAFTPQLSNGTNGEISFQAKSLTDNFAGGERFQVGVSTSNDGTGITYLTPSPYVVPPTTWTAYSYAIPPSFDNQDIYVTIHVVSQDEFVFMLDSFRVTADVVNTTSVQTTVNTNTSFSANLITSGTIYSTDSNTGDRMLDIVNTSGFNYGCIDVAVSRAGSGAQAYDSQVIADFAMDKSFTITTDNATDTGDNTVIFYFSEAEILGWENATGNSRNNLVAYRENGNEVVNLTESSNTGTVSFSGNFTGLDGAFFFGTTNSFNNSTLDVNDVIFDGVKLFPNPTSSIVNIEGLNRSDILSIQLFTITGQKVNTFITVNMSIDLSALNQGVYFMLINTQSGSKSYKILKN